MQKKLLILGGAIIVFLLIYRMKRPETAAQVFNQIVDGAKGGFIFPTVDTVQPANYTPSIFNINTGAGYTPSEMPAINFTGGSINFGGGVGSSAGGGVGSIVKCGCNASDILPGSPRVQERAIAQSTTQQQSFNAATIAAAFAANRGAFGGGGSRMVQ